MQQQWLKLKKKRKTKTKTIGTQTQNNEKNVENEYVIFIKKIPSHPWERLKSKTVRVKY